MAIIDFHADAFTVRFSTAEKLAGLVRDMTVPYRAVRVVDVVEDGIRAARGLRAPGTAIPGRLKVGTWRSREGKALVSVTRGRPAVRVALEGNRFSEVLLSVDDAEAVRARLDGARG